jgi:hypothetical protein
LQLELDVGNPTVVTLIGLVKGQIKIVFLSSLLEELVSNLTLDRHDKVIQTSRVHRGLLYEKGIYPYD